MQPVRSDLLIIVPASNEKRNGRNAVREIHTALPHPEVLVSHDGATDLPC